MDIQRQIEILDETLLVRVKTLFPNVLMEDEKAVVNSFLVLSHAILEEYIEIEFENYVNRLEKWLSPPIPAQVPWEVALFCFHAGAVRGSIEKYATANAYRLLMDGHRDLQGRIKANNGVKTKNIQGLAKTAGVDWQAFESALSAELADLETLGACRGEAVHLSPFTAQSKVLTDQVYPDDVRAWVENARVAAEAIVRRLNDLPER